MDRMSPSSNYRKLSLWLDTVPGTLVPAEPLSGDLDIDVAIAGAGYTGLWAAYYLARAEPGLRIAVCEREIAGFGASGRNGGWCSALFPASLGKLARMAGRDAAIAMGRAMQQTVDEVAAAAAAEGIDCHWAKGGTVQLARSGPQLERARAEVAEAREFGFGDADLRLLTAAEARDLAAAGDADRARPPGHADGHGPGQARDPRHGGLHAATAGPAARDRAGVLADDRDGAAAGFGLGRDRPRGQTHVR